MASFRSLILAASTLAQGATLRLHLQNLNAGGGDVTVQIFGEMEVELMPDLEVELEADLEVTLEPELQAELEPELEVEVC